MNILLWILQAALGLLYFSGGAFKASSSAELAGQMPALPPGGWVALGVFEVIGAVLLILPAALKRMPMLTPLAAAALALETLGLAIFYAQHSLELAATNPLVWAVVMGVLAALVAYGRYAQRGEPRAERMEKA